METKLANPEPYAHVIVKLLQGAIYQENQKLWNDLLAYQTPVNKYFARIAIEVIIDRTDGYAFIKQMPLDDEDTTIGLVRRGSFSYELSLLCVLLRQLLDEFEVSTTEQRKLYITHKRLKEELEMFFKEKANKVKLIKELDNQIKEVEKLDFLKKISKDDIQKDDIQYEVRSIIKAKITNDILEEFKRKLQNENA